MQKLLISAILLTTAGCAAFDVQRLFATIGPTPTASATPMDPYNYKGIAGYRHIDTYSDAELEDSARDELIASPTSDDRLEQLNKDILALGYATRASRTMILVKLPTDSVATLRKHWKMLAELPDLKSLSPNFRLSIPEDE